MDKLALGVVAIALVFAAYACSDDASPPADGGMDSSLPDGGGGTGATGGTMNGGGGADAGVDAGGDAGTPNACGGPGCDLLDENSCGGGQGCQFLLPADPADGDDPFPQCVAAGDGTSGDSCSGMSDCAAGFGCDISVGQCRKFCCESFSVEECPTSQACLIDILGAGDEPTGVGYCAACDSCDLVEQTGCADGLGCYPLPSLDGSDSGCTLCLESVMNQAEGESCVSANDCEPGLGCFADASGTGSECLEFCDLNESPDPCQGPRTCTEVTGASLGEGVGLCFPNN